MTQLLLHLITDAIQSFVRHVNRIDIVDADVDGISGIVVDPSEYGGRADVHRAGARIDETLVEIGSRIAGERLEKEIEEKAVVRAERHVGRPAKEYDSWLR